MAEHEKMNRFRAQMADIAILAKNLNNIVQMPAHDSVPAEDALIMVGLSTLAGMVYEAGFIPAEIIMDSPEGMKLRDQMMDVAEQNDGDPRAIYKSLLDVLAPGLGIAGKDESAVMDGTISDTDLEKLLKTLSEGSADTDTI